MKALSGKELQAIVDMLQNMRAADELSTGALTDILKSRLKTGEYLTIKPHKVSLATRNHYGDLRTADEVNRAFNSVRMSRD